MLTILVVLFVTVEISISFNLDFNYPIIYEISDKNFSFGYTVLLRSGPEIDKSWIYIGAPFNEARQPFRTNRNGAIYKCPILKPCSIVKKGKLKLLKQHGFLGMAMDSHDSSDSFVVCNPRWSSDREQFTPGVCLWTKNSSGKKNRILDPFLELENQSTNNRFAWEYALAGMSVHMPSGGDHPSAIIGAPAVNLNDGAVIIYKNLTNKRDAGIIFEVGPVDQYFGYAVSSGHFFDKDKNLYVASAPHGSLYKGKVVVFEIPEANVSKDIIATLKGKQAGEYFGYCLGVTDINGDGFDDLLIGAPMWFQEEDEGRIYIYFSDPTKRVFTSGVPLTGSSFPRARFGSAVQSLGDLDMDNYNDVAIGAPYEEDGRGAVYIYYGAPNGFTNSKRTRIAASNVYPYLRGFGASISRPGDIDNNGFLDVAVGSFISGHAVIFRAHPVVDITQRLRFYDNYLTRNSTKFTITVCLTYATRNQQHAIKNLGFHITITADPELKRVFFQVGSTALSTFELILHLEDEKESCRDITLILKSGITNFIELIEIEMTTQFTSKGTLKQPIVIGRSISGGPDNFCYDCPVSSSYTKASLSIPFQFSCGSKATCVADLRIEANIDGTKNKTWILGSNPFISLTVEVNNKGDDAYLAKLHILIPKLVTITIPPSCELNYYQTLDCNEIICSLGNPFPMNQKKFFSIPLNLSEVKLTANQSMQPINITLTVTTTSNSINFKEMTKVLTVTPALRRDVPISGHSARKVYYFLNSTKQLKEVVNFKQFFQVSSVQEIQIKFRIPFKILNKDNRNFLHINIPNGYGQVFHCKEDFIDKDYEGVRRETPLKNDSYFELTCNTTICYNMICRGTIEPIKNWQTTALMEMEMELNMTVLKPLIKNFEKINFTVEATFMIGDSSKNMLPLFSQQIFVSSLFEASPIARTFGTKSQIVLLVMTLLLPVILLALLFKTGFFNRHYKMRLQLLKKIHDSTQSLEQNKEMCS